MNILVKVKILILFSILLVSCSLEQEEGFVPKNNKKSYDYAQIKKRGKLIAVTQYNSTDYFIYRGNPMGFQKELLQNLSNYLDIPLEIKVDNDLSSCFSGLNRGKYDIVAVGLTVTKTRKDSMLFTEPIAKTYQVLVQKLPDNWRRMSKKEVNKYLIKSPTDLAGKTIYVEKGSSFISRLKNLSEEIGAKINIVETEDETVEELIKKVSLGEIEYTVSDKHIAQVSKTYYNNINIDLKISLEQNLAWALRKDDDTLLTKINTWLHKFKKSRKYALLINKYYKNKRSTNKNMAGFISGSNGEISNYDYIIKAYSKELGWDWRLLASLIYQESRFNNKSKSWAGAFGLMQLMPNTAERFGVDSLASPNANIQAGVRFLKWLDSQLSDIKDSTERLKFVLAAYNVGLGHVLDARRLAKKNGENPDVWSGNVDYYLLNKSKPKYYKDPVVKYGYCRGDETYDYVSEIIHRYEHYKNLVNDTSSGNNTR